MCLQAGHRQSGLEVPLEGCKVDVTFVEDVSYGHYPQHPVEVSMCTSEGVKCALAKVSMRRTSE